MKFSNPDDEAHRLTIFWQTGKAPAARSEGKLRKRQGTRLCPAFCAVSNE